MASSSWPDGSPRTVDDNEYEILGAAWSTDGLVGSPSDTSVVYADSTGMQVKVRSGKYAVVHGKGWFSGASDITKAIASNSSGQPRIDLVVLGLDRSTQVVTEYVKTGTAAATPAPPALLRDPAGAGTGKWEIPIAQVAVASGAATISAGNVTVVAPWIAAGTMILPNLDTLNRIAAPTPGSTALIGDALYLFTASNGWRRADWNSAWGVIGGREYTGIGLVTAAGVGFSEVVVNLDSGAVTVTTGRRYQVRVLLRHDHNTNGAMSIFFIRENSLSGAQRALHVVGPAVTGLGYQDWIEGEWSETAGSTRTFVVTGSNGSGTMNVFRTNAETNRTVVEVVDMGPAAALTLV